MHAFQKTLNRFCVAVYGVIKKSRLKQSTCGKIASFSRWTAVVILSTTLLCLNLVSSYKSYHTAIYTTPPRSSAVDHSLDFEPSNPTPLLYSRHTTPWRKYPDLQPDAIQYSLSPDLSKNRYFVSSAGREVGDGLGHRFLVVSYERRLALALNLSYVHPRPTYGSLTAFQRNAVDGFFGWVRRGEKIITRGSFFREVCQRTVRRMQHNNCTEKMIFCKRLRRGNGLVERLVQIPENVAFCLKHSKGASSCDKLMKTFAEQHPHPNTLFYTPPTTCSWKLYWSDQHLTRGWFHDRYWSAPRKSRMDPRFVNIAVHVRRGDFLKTRRRTTISDTAYARVVRRIVSIISEEEFEYMDASKNAPRNLRFKVHIYSQGAFQPQTSHPVIRYLAGKGLFGYHNVNDYGTRYVSEKGVETPDMYWEELLGSHKRITSELHISEDTLEGLEQMIAADILVGSASALSVHIGAQLSRGIPFLPVRPPSSACSNKTIQWDPTGSGGVGGIRKPGPDDLFFNAEHFRIVWREYRQHIGAGETPLGLPDSFNATQQL